MKHLIDIVRATIAENGLLLPSEQPSQDNPPTVQIVVGFSGGADSCALLHVLKFGLGLRVFACHLNHVLRGEESERDERFVRERCAEWEIPCLVCRIDIGEMASADGLTVEEAGRKARYRWFAEAAAEVGTSVVIATAHTASDNVETILFNLARGAGTRGLCGIPASRSMEGGFRVIRPLLDCTRQQVEEYCAENGVTFVTDSTNLCDEYTRNRIRHIVVPALQKINPNLEESVRRTARVLADEDTLLDAIAREALEAACLPDIGQRKVWSVRDFLRQPSAVRRRMAALLLRWQGAEPDFASVERLCGMLEAGSAKKAVRWQFSGSVFAEARGGMLLFGQPLPPLPEFAFELNPGIAVTIGDKTYSAVVWELSGMELPKKVQRNLLYLTLDYDTINSKLTLRQKCPSDAVAIAGRGGTKTLKKLFREAALDTRQRSEVPVLVDAAGIAGVYGFGPACRCALKEGTRRVLIFAMEEMLAALPDFKAKNGG